VPSPVDVWLATGAAVAVILGSGLAAAVQQPPRPLDVWAVTLMIAAAGALAWRRAAPMVALGGAVGVVRSNQEIAKELFLSPDTVRTHIGRAMGKLGARDRAQLVVFAVRAGLAIPEE
jgi:DNA-binding CsgD family transcriptional regulator